MQHRPLTKILSSLLAAILVLQPLALAYPPEVVMPASLSILTKAEQQTEGAKISNSPLLRHDHDPGVTIPLPGINSASPGAMGPLPNSYVENIFQSPEYPTGWDAQVAPASCYPIPAHHEMGKMKS